ncbi:MAG TPA: aminoglycoside phosphotransferase family protein [Candidatus Saccharimonadales bacterium]|nr:aminoglycoside phosphotransferase family protein [Candidatus Saccharimonadales bacterium]
MKKIKEEALIIIKKHYPNISEENIVVSQGNDHDVYIVNNTITFRFPKIPREIDPKKSEFLKKLVSVSPFPIPSIEVHIDNETGISYEMNEFISGVSFYPAIAETFSHEELMFVAQKLGEFLSVIHAYPLEEARKLHLDEMDPEDFWAYMEQNPNAFPKFKALVYPYIFREEQEWIERLFKDYIALVRETPFETRVTHADMWTYHIIVDPDKHTFSGVIDFWGRIADPANDFKAFEYYGSDFVKEVYKGYTLPRDENFEKRRLFYTGHDEVFELARSIERGDERKIKICKESLSAYIKAHPLT